MNERAQPINSPDQIGLYLFSLLEGITKANGYETDIGVLGFRGRRAIADDQPPCFSLIEGEDFPGDKVGREEVKVTINYAAVGYDKCDPDYPNDKAQAIVRDIKKALWAQGPRMGGRVHSLAYNGRDIGPRPDGVALVMAVVHFSVSVAENLPGR